MLRTLAFSLLFTSLAYAAPEGCAKNDFFDIHWKHSTNTVSPNPSVYALDDSRKVDIGDTSFKVLRSQDVSTVDQFLTKFCTTSFLVIKDNRIIYEHYFQGRDKDDKLLSASMAKTILALLYGVAEADGKIRLDEKVTDILPDFAGSAFDEDTVEDLLRMSSKAKLVNGFEKGTDTDNRNINPLIAPKVDVREYLRNKREKLEQRVFAYNGAQTVLLGLLLRERLHMPLAEYLETKIWKPMGAENKGYWVTNDRGQEGVGGQFVATPRDYARVGLLVMNKGRLNGQQIVPEDWIRRMTELRKDKLQPANAPYYGLQIWIPAAAGGRSFLWGTNGQNIFIDPAAHTIIVHTGDSPDAEFDGNAYLFGLRDTLIARIKSME